MLSEQTLSNSNLQSPPVAVRCILLNVLEWYTLCAVPQVRFFCATARALQDLQDNPQQAASGSANLR